MAKRCRTILTGAEVCSIPEQFAESYLGQGIYSPWSTKSQEVFDLMDTDPFPTELKTIMATAIDAMVADGNFAELGQLLVVLDTQANSLTDWMGNQNALAVASPTFDAFDHWEFNQATQYINTQFSATANPKATLNSTNVGVWVVSHDGPSSIEFLFGSLGSGGNDVLDLFSNTPTDLRCQVNNTNPLTETAESSFASNSLYTARRIASDNIQMVKNGVITENEAQPSEALGTDNIYWGSRNNDGTADFFFGGKVFLYYAGSGNINTLNLFNVFNTMITDIAALG